jgi:hypothetical protein
MFEMATEAAIGATWNEGNWAVAISERMYHKVKVLNRIILFGVEMSVPKLGIIDLSVYMKWFVNMSKLLTACLLNADVS